jgi:cytoskeletal protein CcmA (bactofilin family)
LKKATSRDNTNETFDIIIGKNTKIDGDITSQGSMRIEGSVNGSLEALGNIIIGSNATIVGNASCKNIEISGNLKGNLKAIGSLQVYSGGTLTGDIEVISFNIEEGGSFDGNCTIKKVTSKNPSESKE